MCFLSFLYMYIHMERISSLLIGRLYGEDAKSIARFRKRVIELAGGHLILKGSKSKTYPHGCFHFDGTCHSAHHFWWQLCGNEIPKGFYLKTTCDLPQCIACEHMKLVKYGTKKL